MAITSRKRRRTRGTLMLLLLLLMPVSGCYTYVPLPPGAPEPAEGRDVELRLTAPGAVRLAERTGRTDRTLRGELMEAGDDRLQLRVPTPAAPQPVGAAGPRLGTVVAIPRSDIGEISTRELHRGRTAAFIAGSVVGATAIVLAALGLAGELSSEEEPDNPAPALGIPRGIPLAIPFGSIGW